MKTEELTLNKLLSKGQPGIEMYNHFEELTGGFIPEKTRMLLRDVQNYYTERRYTKDEVDLLTLYPEKRKEFEEITKFFEGKLTAPQASTKNNNLRQLSVYLIKSKISYADIFLPLFPLQFCIVFQTGESYSRYD
jgi:hypothetical protein